MAEKTPTVRDLKGGPARSKRGWLVYAFALAACLAVAGCNNQPYMSPDRLNRGLVIVLPGIEGRSGYNEAICRGLDGGGVSWAIELYDWTSPLGALYNLGAYDHNRRKASEIGWRISRYHHKYPGRPVVLVGQSGGAAMAVWTSEQLLPGESVDGIVLLAASLSPQYILDFALENSRRGIVSFHSKRDWVFLGVGTTVYGTMDGRHTWSAGQVGFDSPAIDESLAAYRKLFQVGWRSEMAEAGFSGGHLTSGAENFVSRYVAPIIVAREARKGWDEALIESLLDAGGGSEDQAQDMPASRPATAPAQQAPTNEGD